MSQAVLREEPIASTIRLQTATPSSLLVLAYIAEPRPRPPGAHRCRPASTGAPSRRPSGAHAWRRGRGRPRDPPPSRTPAAGLRIGTRPPGRCSAGAPAARAMAPASRAGQASGQSLTAGQWRSRTEARMAVSQRLRLSSDVHLTQHGHGRVMQQSRPGYRGLIRQGLPCLALCICIRLPIGCCCSTLRNAGCKAPWQVVANHRAAGRDAAAS